MVSPTGPEARLIAVNPMFCTSFSSVNRRNKANRDPFLRKSWHKTLVLERWRAEFVAQEFDFDAKAAS